MKRINNKFYSLLGLCCKAGKLVSGSMMCEKTIRSGKAHLVIVSSEASQATMDNFTNLCSRNGAKIIIFGEQEKLGHSIGKLTRTVIVIIDEVFKDMILDTIDKEEIQYGGDQ